jgi:hypothetical protein
VGLTRAQQTILEKARALGSGAQGVALTDDQCKALIGVIATDLGIADAFPEVPSSPPSYFSVKPPEALLVADGDLLEMFERLAARVPDGETYFASLAALHKGRLKYRKILATQPIPTIDQVGPRGILEYGGLRTDELVALLFWRKWMYDIDNRAAQETGYVFEPIIAGAIGGAPAPARSSPVKRRSDNHKGRQVDCIRMGRAYEFKLRVTIAASGQGRWREELDFPEDCKASGFEPHLIVFDPTPNPKLHELGGAFEDAGGEAHVGDAAWDHLEELAGPTMATFLDRYLRDPLTALLREIPVGLPEVRLRMDSERVVFAIGGGEYAVRREAPDPELVDDDDWMPDDAADRLPGI